MPITCLIGSRLLDDAADEQPRPPAKGESPLAQKGAHARFVLEPSICEVRRIDTPPLSAANAMRFVASQASGIFFMTGDLSVTIAPIRGSGGRAWMASATTSETLARINTAAVDAGMKIVSIAPMHDYARDVFDQAGNQATEFQWRGEQYEIAIPPARNALRRKTRDAANTVATPTNLTESDILAVSYQFKPRLDFRRQKYSPLRSASLSMATVALTMLACAGWIHVAASGRDLAATRDYRAKISDDVKTASQKRREMQEAAIRIQQLEATDALRFRALAVMREIAERVPETSSLTRLALRGDTLLIEGHSLNTTDLYRRLSKSDLIKDVRLSKPPQRVSPDSGSLEIFSMKASLIR